MAKMTKKQKIYLEMLRLFSKGKIKKGYKLRRKLILLEAGE